MEIYVPYTESSWSGFLAADLVQITSSPQFCQIRASIALITQSNNFFIDGAGWQGILGLGYRPIARVGLVPVCVDFMSCNVAGWLLGLKSCWLQWQLFANQLL